MNKLSPLYQLMDLRLNGIMNDFTAQDEDYQSLIQRADECTDKLESLNLPEETRKLIDRYASECNAIGSCYGVLAYLFKLPDTLRLATLSATSSAVSYFQDFIFAYRFIVGIACWVRACP